MQKKKVQHTLHRCIGNCWWTTVVNGKFENTKINNVCSHWLAFVLEPNKFYSRKLDNSMGNTVYFQRLSSKVEHERLCERQKKTVTMNFKICIVP